MLSKVNDICYVTTPNETRAVWKAIFVTIRLYLSAKIFVGKVYRILYL